MALSNFARWWSGWEDQHRKMRCSFIKNRGTWMVGECNRRHKGGDEGDWGLATNKDEVEASTNVGRVP